MARKPIRREDREKIRQAILDEAGRMLLNEGVHGISMRKLSKQVGASTMVLYNCFENKQEILNELYLRGFAQLKKTLEAVPIDDDPAAYLVALGWAYREAALANIPAYFLMQSRSVPGFTVPEESLRQSKESFKVLVSAIHDCMEAGVMKSGDPGEVAHILWATLHGLISLHLHGHTEDEETAEHRFRQALGIIEQGLGVARKPEEKT